MRVPSQDHDRFSSTRGPGGCRSQRRLAIRAPRVGTLSAALAAGNAVLARAQACLDKDWENAGDDDEEDG